MEKKSKGFSPARVSDNELVIRFQAGDTSAFNELYQRYESKVYRICLGIIKNDEEAKDFTQDTFLSVGQHIRSFRADSAFTTWLHRIAVNCSIQGLRKKKNQPVSLDELMDPANGHAPTEFGREDDSLRFTPERILLEDALDRLPSGNRQVLALRLEGYEHSEIENIFKLKNSESRQKLHRAKKKMRMLVGQYI